MLDVEHTNQFKKDVKLAKKRRKKLDKLKKIMRLITEEKKIPEKYKNHKLSGIYKGCWECHIEPDWLLVYRLNKVSVTFVSTGTHSDLFD